MDEEYDQREIADACLGKVPWYFRVGRYLSRRKLRGGERIIAEARRRGLLDRIAVYQLSDEVTLRVPLWRPCNQWDEQDVRLYESAFVRALSDAVRPLAGPVTLIDCGADIGTVAAHLVARCKNIESVIAFEPNAAAHRLLAANLAAWGLAGEARHAAVGNTSGRGRLVTPDDDPSAHAMYVVPAHDGPIPVEPIDDLQITTPASVIKIDVEGSEESVILGATQTIKRAHQVVVAFEAHYRVCRRTGVEPASIMRALLEIRDFTFEVDTTPVTALSPHVSLFDQLPPTRVYNVIARSV